MDLFQDFKDLLAEFAFYEVEFVLLGGYAVAFHGQPRATKDMDLLVRLSDENRMRLAQALDGFGAPGNVVEAAKVLQEGQVLYFGASPLRIDILANASGIDFNGVYERALNVDLNGTPIKVIQLADLIANKRASGRPQDLLDAEALERIAAHNV